jgi:phosphate:Na+ symporter
MSGTLILLQLGGYVGLLLWGTHMVTTGVERGFGAALYHSFLQVVMRSSAAA